MKQIKLQAIIKKPLIPIRKLRFFFNYYQHYTSTSTKLRNTYALITQTLKKKKKNYDQEQIIQIRLRPNNHNQK